MAKWKEIGPFDLNQAIAQGDQEISQDYKISYNLKKRSAHGIYILDGQVISKN